MAGGSDDRLIEEAVGLVVSPQERLDPLPQLRIGRALTIQDGGAGRAARGIRRPTGTRLEHASGRAASDGSRTGHPSRPRLRTEKEISVEGVAEPGTQAWVRDALNRLASEDPGAAKVIELRQFAGLGHEQVAAALGITVYLARQKWTYARAWLGDVLGG